MFHAPIWLAAGAVAVAAAWGLLTWATSRRRGVAAALGRESALTRVAENPAALRRWSSVLRLAALALIFIALAGPQWGIELVATGGSARQVVVAVDVSLSMQTPDVKPNRLERALWGDLKSLRRQGAKPRVGWAGAQQHSGDLALIIDLVKATADEVDWVFFGMCLEELRPYIKEEHPFVVDFDAYPKKLASLNLDIAVAPLEAHPFNEAKSNLRILEYGALGLPVICSDIYPYQNAPVKRVSNDPQAWATALRERIDDLDAAGVEGDCLRQWVHKHYMLEDHLDEWFSALTR